MQWAVSQAAPFRRMHILGNIVLHQNHGWASGGWMSDALIDGNVDSGTQQQWIARNSEWRSWTGSNWNMVFVGDVDSARRRMAVADVHKSRARSHRARKTISLCRCARQLLRSHSRAARKQRQASPGARGTTPGRSIPLDRFYIAHPGDTAAAINAQLAGGKHLLFTPGIYELTEPIRVTRPGTIVLGLGFATLKPVNGMAALTTADVDGVILAGLLIDAGPVQSPVLVEIGPSRQPRESRSQSHLAP